MREEKNNILFLHGKTWILVQVTKDDKNTCLNYIFGNSLF